MALMESVCGGSNPKGMLVVDQREKEKKKVALVSVPLGRQQLSLYLRRDNHLKIGIARRRNGSLLRENRDMRNLRTVLCGPE